MHTVRVTSKLERDPRGRELVDKAARWLNIEPRGAQAVDLYLIDLDLSAEELARVKEEILVDPVSEKGFSHYCDPDRGEVELEGDWIVQVGLKPGMKDGEGERAKDAIEELLGGERDGQVYTATEYLLEGDLGRGAVETLAEDLLFNELINRLTILKTAELEEREGELHELPLVKADHEPAVDHFGLEELESVSEKRNLALSEADLEAIRDYFVQDRVQEERREADLPAEITDVELEVLAQTQSEHCKHKIFNARIDYLNAAEGEREEIDSLFDTYIKRATEEIDPSWILSTFWDNAGVIEFDGDYAAAMKFETHNSPSAKEPYGGSITGIVGVYRDPMGTGKGFRIVAGAYGFCTPSPFYQGPLRPEISPRNLLEGIVEGVRDGGNKSGIPTVTGYSKYDRSFLGKPLVHVGAVGLAPKEIEGENCWEKDVCGGDLIVMVGGRVGRDGIHGVTESSLEFGEHITAGHVQIGDPFTQKKVQDFILEARDAQLYKLVWDLGGGGLSSAVGETAQFSGGCRVQLEEVPLKYEGLDPWEILVSESQERMLLGVAPEKFPRLKELAQLHDVEISSIGRFKEDGKFVASYEGEVVARLDMDFLHEGFPRYHLEAEWHPPQLEEPVLEGLKGGEEEEILLDILSRPNVASKEWIGRQYDHEVQASTVIKPFAGDSSVPSDAAVIRPLPDSGRGLALGLANNFQYSQIDPYWMAAATLDEAIRRVLAVGAKPDKIALNDNFCWPNSLFDPEDNPQGKENLGKLVRANQALYRFTKEFETPCISGKDSMFIDGNLRDEEGDWRKVSGSPSLQFSALGEVDDVERSRDLVSQKEGDLVYLLGETRDELGASEYYEYLGQVGANVPRLRVAQARRVYRAVHRAIEKGLLASCSGIYRGGLAVTLAEKCIASGLGMEVDLGAVPAPELEEVDKVLYSESPSRFVVTLQPKFAEEFEGVTGETKFARIGEVRGDRLQVWADGGKLIDLGLVELEESYRGTFEEF